MIITVLILLAGLALILFGANYLTDGASALGKRMGLSDMMVGLTIVAFGTSTPELTISVIAALGGSGEMAVGNVVGSNIFNTLAIVGVVALCRPIVINKSLMTNEIPLVILASVALTALGCAPWLDAGVAEVNRVEGILLLLFFAVFMRYVVASARNDSGSDNAAEPETAIAAMPLWKSIVFTLGGLAALIWGGDMFVDSASKIAAAMGVSEAVIGLTIVAAGTSLPELAASVVAALKGNPGIALGNVIGSNIFNIFLVLGLSAAVSPLTFGGIGLLDLSVLLGSALLFWLFGWKFRVRTITRVEGGVMALCYVAYITLLVVMNLSPKIC